MIKILAKLCLLLCLFACTQSADFTIHNLTSEPIEFTIKGHDYVVDAEANFSKSFETGRDFLSFNHPKVEIPITNFQGNLFAIKPSNVVLTKTIIVLKGDKDLAVYCNSYNGAIRLHNQSANRVVTKITYSQAIDKATQYVILTNIAIGESEVLKFNNAYAYVEQPTGPYTALDYHVEIECTNYIYPLRQVRFKKNVIYEAKIN